jgi:hypothetical protein
MLLFLVGKSGGGANDERESTLNQLLVEMDGFDNSQTVVVLASTNRADILDSALTRPGRFDRQVAVEKPDLDGRKEVFEVHLKNIKLKDPDITQFSSRLAALTPGFSGADIANVCNEAAIVAARASKSDVDFDDFEAGIQPLLVSFCARIYDMFVLQISYGANHWWSGESQDYDARGETHCRVSRSRPCCRWLVPAARRSVTEGDNRAPIIRCSWIRPVFTQRTVFANQRPTERHDLHGIGGTSQ